MRQRRNPLFAAATSSGQRAARGLPYEKNPIRALSLLPTRQGYALSSHLPHQREAWGRSVKQAPFSRLVKIRKLALQHTARDILRVREAAASTLLYPPKTKISPRAVPSRPTGVSIAKLHIWNEAQEPGPMTAGAGFRFPSREAEWPPALRAYSTINVTISYGLISNV